MDFIGAGVETTSGAAVFVLYALASNPDKQEKLRKEINEKFDQNNVTGKVNIGFVSVNADTFW